MSKTVAKPNGGDRVSKPHDEALPAGLYITSTPIGNARDISLRGLDVLARADVIACEDTRVTRKLLSIHNIRTPMISYHDHNGDRVRPQIIARIEKGEAVALVSDAGTPLINDPGFKLVCELRELELPVTAVPGASSILTALTLAGLPTDRFLYLGFLPPKEGARQSTLGGIKAVEASLVVLESPARLARSLADMALVLGPRDAAVTREMTKKFEEVRRGTLSDLAAHYAEQDRPKGEIVIVIGPPSDHDQPLDTEDLDARLKDLLKTHRVKDAAAIASMETGLPKRDLYDRAQKLKDGRDGD